jgi:hypothetical protein
VATNGAFRWPPTGRFPWPPSKHGGVRQEVFVHLMRAGGVFGPGLTFDELQSSLLAAGLIDLAARRDGALAYFSARKPLDRHS